MGFEHKWLTVVSPEDPDGTQLLLEPSDNPAAVAFKTALFEQGIPVSKWVHRHAPYSTTRAATLSK